MALATLQAQLVDQTDIDATKAITPLAIFDADGTAVDLSGLGGVTAAADVAAVATATATDLPTAIALVNQLKTTVNALLAALKASGEEE